MFQTESAAIASIALLSPVLNLSIGVLNFRWGVNPISISNEIDPLAGVRQCDTH